MSKKTTGIVIVVIIIIGILWAIGGKSSAPVQAPAEVTNNQPQSETPSANTGANMNANTSADISNNGLDQDTAKIDAELGNLNNDSAGANQTGN